jgi:hypothetical protein
MVESVTQRHGPPTPPRRILMKLLAAGATVVALGLLTAGCSSGSGTKAAAPSTAGVTSTTAIAAPSPSGVATPAAAGSAGVGSSATPTGIATTAQPTAAGTDLGSAATTTTSASEVASSSAAQSATTGGKAAPVVVCATLPTAQVASLSGRALTSSREQDLAADNSYTCAYYTASGVGGLSVTVAVVGGAVAYASSLSVDSVAGSPEHVTPVAGLGDKAFSARDGVRALFGDRMIYVAGLTTVQPAEAIIEALQAKLN